MLKSVYLISIFLEEETGVFGYYPFGVPYLITAEALVMVLSWMDL